MARTFKSAQDTGVTVYPPHAGAIRIDAGATYTTDDPAEIAALEGASLVAEVRAARKPEEKPKAEDDKPKAEKDE